MPEDDGLVTVSIEMTDAEYTKITEDWALTAEGTRQAAIRKRLGLPEKPKVDSRSRRG